MIDAVTRYSLNNRLLSVFIVILICVLGIIAWSSMPVDVYPDLNAPLVNIVTESPGMSAEDVERLITFPLESILNGSPGITRIRSESSTGISVVTVEFDWNTDVYLARQIVNGKLKLVAGQLPAGTSNPILGPISSRMGEVFEFVLMSDSVDLMKLRELADWVVRYRLLGTSGVSYVVNLGGFVREFQVLLKPGMLHSYGVTIADVREAIASSNRNSTGGILTQRKQEYLIRGLGQIQSVDDIANIVVESRDNVPIYIRNLAEVKIGSKFRRGSAGHNGKAAVKVTVEKQFRGNTLETIDNVKATLAEAQKDLPDGVEIYPFYDQSIFIKNSTSNIQKSIIQGAVLITLVIVLFMGNLRSALIAVITIPYSILIAVLMMWFFGVTINVMSLGGLAIGIGKMANSSIFVVENIYRKLLADKKKPEAERTSVVRICYEATREVSSALFSSGLIIFLVFVPMFFMQGIEGKMFAPTAFAVGMALIGSLVGAVTIKPVLASLLLRRIKAERENPVIRNAQKIYMPILQLFLRFRYISIFIVALLIAAASVVILPSLGSEFMPQMDEGAILASTQMLPGTSLEEATRVGREIELRMLDKKKFPEIVSVTRETGRAEQSEHSHPVSHCHFTIELIPKDKRARSVEEIIEALRTELQQIPGIRYIFEQPIQNKLAEMLTGTEGELAVKLFGPDLETLNEKIEEIYTLITSVEGTSDAQIEQTIGVPRINIILDRDRMARYGVKVDDVGDTIETALNGMAVTDVLLGNRRFSILLRFPWRDRNDIDKIGHLLIDTPSGQRIPLFEMATIEKGEGPQEIFRENLERRKVILLNVSRRDIGGYVDEARRLIEQNVELPAGYRLVFGGQFENQRHASQQLIFFSVIIALVVFITLVSSFKSLRQSLLILLGVPIPLVGGLIGLWLAGATLNVSSAIGFIALFGISLQNGIILIGTFNSLREGGRSLLDAVLEGSRMRLRPILMTELVMIFGALPLVFGTETGSEIHRPLAIVYVGGFLLALFLSKFVLPALYYLFESWRRGSSSKTRELLATKKL